MDLCRPQEAAWLRSRERVERDLAFAPAYRRHDSRCNPVIVMHETTPAENATHFNDL
jgi:hypothetical protein